MTRSLRPSALWAVPLALGMSIAIPAHASHPQPIPTKPEHARTSAVSLWTLESPERAVSLRSFAAFEAEFKNGGEVATGDVDGDGASEIVVGAGPGRVPEVRVFENDGTRVASFRAYPFWFKGGVRVVAADVDGDGKAEIVTSPGPGMPPQVNIFRGNGTRVTGTYVYASGFQGGVHVAAADFDGDGKAEIVTSPGPGGGPHVRFWSGELASWGKEAFAYDAGMADGVSIAVVATPDGPQLVTAPESWSAPLVRRFRIMAGTATLAKEFYARSPSSHAGMRVAAFDADGDGTDEILTTANGSTAPDGVLFDLFGSPYVTYQLADGGYRGAISIAQADVNGDGRHELVTILSSPTVLGPLDAEKFIEVDLARQRLYAYERGRIARTFLVSTGTTKYPTPVMETTVLQKVPVKDYRWSYGRNHPDNYNLPNVKWNLQIRGPYNIHYAYWHNNFGHRMSHGCVNVGKADAEWIYNWADVGTKVVTHPGTLVAGSSTLAKK